MKRTLILSVLTAGLLGAVPSVVTAADDHKAVSAEQLQWKQHPALPKGTEVAVLSGDPSKEGPFVLRLRFPAGLKVPPHTHPGDENGTVLSGTFNIGMGETFDESKGQSVEAQGFILVPKGTVHYAWVDEDTLIQFHGIGPSAITYVNPADDPRKTQ